MHHLNLYLFKFACCTKWCRLTISGGQNGQILMVRPLNLTILRELKNDEVPICQGKF